VHYSIGRGHGDRISFIRNKNNACVPGGIVNWLHAVGCCKEASQMMEWATSKSVVKNDEGANVQEAFHFLTTELQIGSVKINLMKSRLSLEETARLFSEFTYPSILILSCASSHQTHSLVVSNKVVYDLQDSSYLDEGELTPLIYGYLHKLGRNGHWQKRFFETNGERLTYYKSGKRKKVLATLDLYKVGEIAIDKTDPEECTFTIQVSNRPYYLRAEDKARCNDWVIILNRAREARHGWGNIQLVNPTGIDDDVVGGVGGGRSQAGSDDEFGPCIVISALRPRTQAVNYGEDDAVLPPDLLSAGGVGGSEEQEQIEVLDGRDNPQLLMMQHQQQQQQQYQMEDEQQLQGGRPVAVKWQKRHSAVHHLSMRMLNWARSITSNADACRRQKDVVVVPAHVMRSMMSQSVAASGIGGEQTGMGGEGGPIGAAIAAEASAAPTPGGINVTRPSVSGAPKGLQDVLEETPSTEANDGERERKRTESSESTSGGMGSSQYV